MSKALQKLFPMYDMRCDDDYAEVVILSKRPNSRDLKKSFRDSFIYLCISDSSNKTDQDRFPYSIIWLRWVGAKNVRAKRFLQLRRVPAFVDGTCQNLTHHRRIGLGEDIAHLG